MGKKSESQRNSFQLNNISTIIKGLFLQINCWNKCKFIHERTGHFHLTEDNIFHGKITMSYLLRMTMSVFMCKECTEWDES